MYTTDESVTVRVILRPKKDEADVILHICLWLLALMFGILSFMERSFPAFMLSVLFIAVSLVYAFYMQTKQITVSDLEIDVQCFWIFHRKVKWEQIRTYRLIHKAGSYCNRRKHIDYSKYIEELYTIQLDCGGIFPVRISNRYTDYKKFKQILKEKNIRRLDTVRK